MVSGPPWAQKENKIKYYGLLSVFFEIYLKIISKRYWTCGHGFSFCENQTNCFFGSLMGSYVLTILKQMDFLILFLSFWTSNNDSLWLLVHLSLFEVVSHYPCCAYQNCPHTHTSKIILKTRKKKVIKTHTHCNNTDLQNKIINIYLSPRSLVVFTLTKWCWVVAWNVTQHHEWGGLDL